MSTTLQPPPAPPAPPRAAPAAGTPPSISQLPGRRADLLLGATVALLVAACLPLTRVFVGLDFLRPVLGAVLLAVGLSWGARRLGAGPVTSLLVSVLGWAAFCSAAFFPDTLALGVLPTRETFEAAVELWIRGVQLMSVRQPPAFAEAGLIFLTLTGVWSVAHAVEGLVFRLGAPVKAIAMAMLLWTVPLTLTRGDATAWPWAVPLLAAGALLLLGFAGDDVTGWDRRPGRGAPAGDRPEGLPLLPTGSAIAAVAIVAGALVAGSLPGFGQAPWYELRGLGGTTLTTNPIVDIRSRLVATNRGPVLRVAADRPVYLRTTSLDRYSEAEEWTNSGIRGEPIDGDVPFEVPLNIVEQVNVDVEVVDLPQAVLVPAPYQAARVSGPVADAFQYDQRNSTLTLDPGRTLQAGDRYSVVATIPAPDPDQLATVRSWAPGSALTQLPDNVPTAVTDLAQRIVSAAGANTPFRQALAIQNELRSWTYSTTPPQGHSGQAMAAFLDSRTGYCEQFAGTMAVMLRSLDIPARVAVGYTPGQPLEPEVTDDAGQAVAGPRQFVVTNGNAHAWVEVLFPGVGWVAFEPTPRADGNVLVPTAANLAPSITAASAPEDFEPVASVPEEDQLFLPDPGAGPSETPSESVAAGGGAAGGPGADQSVLLVLLGLVGVALLAGGVARARGDTTVERLPSDRVLHAFAGVERVGRGLGVAPAGWETDTEYLRRLAASSGNGVEAARRLGAHMAQARYATALPATVAERSESAAGALTAQLLEPLPAGRRLLVRLRGTLAMAVTRVRGRVRRLSRRT